LALFSSFAADSQPALIAVDILEIEADQFADTESATVEEFENGDVAGGMRAVELPARHSIE